MAVTQQDALLKLSYLLGESTIPTTGAELDQRKSFLQSTLEEIYRLHPFELNQVTATVAVVSGVASLATNVLQDSALDVRKVTSGSGDDNVFTQVPYSESDTFGAGDYRYWLTGYQGTTLLNTKEADQTLTVRYTTSAPLINGSVSTPFPDPMILALGALRYVRMSQNPFADIATEEEMFSTRLSEFIATYNRNTPRKYYKTVQEREGHHTGQI